jgi:hypothetical protein
LAVNNQVQAAIQEFQNQQAAKAAFLAQQLAADEEQKRTEEAEALRLAAEVKETARLASLASKKAAADAKVAEIAAEKMAFENKKAEEARLKAIAEESRLQKEAADSALHEQEMADKALMLAKS